MRKPRREVNPVRADSGQIARSGPRKCAESNADEKGRDALPLTFVSSWSTTLAAGFGDAFPQDMTQHGQRSGQRRAAECSPTAPKLTRQRPAFRGGLLASSGACANLCCRVLRTGVAGQVSCFCALRVPPSRKAMAGRAARPHRD